MIAEMVREVLGFGLISLHTDMSTKTGERIIVLTLDGNIEERYR